MDKERAEAAIAEYFANPGLYFSKVDVERAIDAFVYLRFSPPPALCDTLGQILQETAEPGIVMKVEPYLGRVRVLAIKAKAAAAWAARPPEEHD